MSFIIFWLNIALPSLLVIAQKPSSLPTAALGLIVDHFPLSDPEETLMQSRLHLQPERSRRKRFDAFLTFVSAL